MTEKKESSHALLAEEYLGKGDYEAAEKEFIAGGEILLACKMWLYEGNMNLAEELAERAIERAINEHREDMAAKEILSSIRNGTAREKYYNKKLGAKKLLAELHGETVGGMTSKVMGGVVAFVGLFAGIFFLYSDTTGNVIVDLPGDAVPFIGFALIAVGLVVGFFLLNRRRR